MKVPQPDPLSVPCPICNARVKVKCWRPRLPPGRRYQTHLERIHVAWKAMNKPVQAHES